MEQNKLITTYLFVLTARSSYHTEFSFSGADRTAPFAIRREDEKLVITTLAVRVLKTLNQGDEFLSAHSAVFLLPCLGSALPGSGRAGADKNQEGGAMGK